jgi:hypothetical protein
MLSRRLTIEENLERKSKEIEIDDFIDTELSYIYI